MDRMQLTEVKPQPAPRRGGMAFGVATVVVAAIIAVAGVALVTRNNGDSSAGVGAPVATPTPPPSPASIASTCLVSTLAGKAGEPGAVDGVGAEARFSDEIGFLAFDADDGLLYVADSGNHAIRKITRDGVVTTFAGKLGAAGHVDGRGPEARFDKPVGLALWDSLWVADFGNDAVRQIAPDGAVTTAAKGLTSPWSIALRTGWGADNMVYIGEQNGGAIQWFRVGGAGDVRTLAGTPGVPNWGVDGKWSFAGFGWPFGMVNESEANHSGARRLYVVDVNADRSASALRLATNSGIVSTLPFDQSYGRPGVPWVDDAGTIYLTTFLDNTVVKRADDGSVTLLAGGRGVEGSVDGTGDVARFSGPMGIVGDGKGTLYVVDAFNSTIRTIRCP